MKSLREALRSLPSPVGVDVSESPSAYRLDIDLPGATAETVDATIAGGRLRIEATREKDVPREFTYRSEERSLFLDVQLPLPPDATGAGAEGRMDRGVLVLHLPKRTAPDAASIPIEGS